MVVQHLHTVPGVSSNLTFTTNFISLKCYLVAFAVWGRRVLVRIQVGRPVFALVSLVVEVLFCNQGVEVRFLPGAPSFVSVSKRSHAV